MGCSCVIPPFVNIDWPTRHPGAVLADVRWYPDGRSGREAFEAGHIPGAVFVDLDADLAAPPGVGGRHPLPSAAHFAQALGRRGIADDAVVVAYDDAGGVFAARLVWMLRAIGRDAALLSGGLTAWEGDLDEGPSHPSPVERVPVEWPGELLADADLAASGSMVTLDGRTAERFAGAPSPLDPRPGHVPGAVSAPVGGNLDADGRVREPGELRARFAALGVDDARRAGAYLGSGLTACHNLLGM